MCSYQHCRDQEQILKYHFMSSRINEKYIQLYQQQKHANIYKQKQKHLLMLLVFSKTMITFKPNCIE